MNLQVKLSGDRIDRALELIVVWVLITSGLGLVTTLTAHFLAIQVCVASTMLTCFYAWRIPATTSRESPSGKHLLILVLLCLFFRLPAYHYIFGGQDEGIYVNVAHYIERTGHIFVRDQPLDRLADSPFVQRYTQENRNLESNGIRLDSPSYVNGVYVRAVEGSRLDFQFYHLFPVWMAVFAGILGGGYAIYALTFFALLSVVFTYRLVLSLSGSTRAALIAATLLACNPLHAFFSKFPVTEVPTLCFWLIGFTYLLRYWNNEPGARAAHWLAISASFFGVLFVTRISGFMYIPFVFAIGVASAAVDMDTQRKRSMQWWQLAVLLFYVVSVFYGLHWSRQYSVDIYRKSFGLLFAEHWRSGTFAAVIAAIIFWVFCLIISKSGSRSSLKRFIVEPIRVVLAPILLVSCALAIYKIYRLGWTSHYAGDDWLNEVWHLPGTHWKAVGASTFWNIFVFTGPLLPIAFVVLAARRSSDARIEFLRLLAIGFFVYSIVLQWTTPYSPYYARYLLSEVVPLMLIFVVVVWASMPKGVAKGVITLTLAVTFLYGTFNTSAQLGKNEGEGLYQTLVNMLESVSKDDVVLIDALDPGLPDNNEIKTPIVYALGLQAITISKQDMENADYLGAIKARYSHVFLMTTLAKPPAGFDAVSETQVTFWGFEANHSYPDAFGLLEDMHLFLDRMQPQRVLLGKVEQLGTLGSWNHMLTSGWNGPESDGTWSLGHHAEIAVDPSELTHVSGHLILSFKAVALVTPAYPTQRIFVSVNGQHVSTTKLMFPGTQAAIDVDLSPSLLNANQIIHIGLDLPDATTPKSLGINEDPRLLGIKLQTFTVNEPTINTNRNPVEQAPSSSPSLPDPRTN